MKEFVGDVMVCGFISLFKEFVHGYCLLIEEAQAKIHTYILGHPCTASTSSRMERYRFERLRSTVLRHAGDIEPIGLEN